MEAYDGYQYAKKKGLTGWKKGAAIVGGALISLVNPFKVASKSIKVAKVVSKTKVVKKVTKAVKKAVSKPKATKIDNKNARSNNEKQEKTYNKKRTLSQIEIERYAAEARI